MKQNESIFDIIITILDFGMAFVCALCAIRNLAREGTGRLRAAILGIAASGAWFACGIAELMRQDRLSIEIVRDCDIPEDEQEQA